MFPRIRVAVPRFNRLPLSGALPLSPSYLSLSSWSCVWSSHTDQWRFKLWRPRYCLDWKLIMGVNLVWSAICFKIMTRYTCVFLPRILAFFPAFGGFYSQVYGQFLTNAYIYAHKKAHTYALQTSMWYTGSQKVVVYIRGTELYRQQKTPSCTRFGSYSLPSQ